MAHSVQPADHGLQQNGQKELLQHSGVKKDAKADEIKKAYRRLARKYHPDVNPNDKVVRGQVQRGPGSLRCLSDEKKRKVFDRFGYYNDNLDPDSPFGAGAAAGGTGTAPGFDFSGFSWDSGAGSGGGSFEFSRYFLGSFWRRQVLRAHAANLSRRDRCRKRAGTSRCRSPLVLKKHLLG